MLNIVANIEYFPFDAGPGSDSLENRWGYMMRWMRTTGILSDSPILGATANCAVAPEINMQLQIYDGEAWVEGFMMIHTGDTSPVLISSNSSGDPRIDLVTIRLDRDANTILYHVEEGTPDPSPTPPPPVQDDVIWDLPLAEIYVADSATVINAMDITDVRVRSIQGESGSAVNSPTCYVYRDAMTTGLADSSTTTLDFDTAILNANAMWEGVTNPERITIVEDGIYNISFLVGWVGVALANGPVEAQVVLNGTTTIGRNRILIVGTDTLYLNASFFYSLSATDYIELDVINNSGQTLSLTSGSDGPSLQAIKIRS